MNDSVGLIFDFPLLSVATTSVCGSPFPVCKVFPDALTLYPGVQIQEGTIAVKAF